MVIDIVEGQKGDQEGGKNGQNSLWGKGGPKMAQMQYGVKPDIFKYAGQGAPKPLAQCDQLRWVGFPSNTSWRPRQVVPAKVTEMCQESEV